MKIDVLGVSYDSLTMDEAVSSALELVQKHSAGYVVTPNPEIIMLSHEVEGLGIAIDEASLVLADGIGVIYGAKILGTPLKSKLPGIDFADKLMAELAKSGKSVFLFGSKPTVAEKAGEMLREKHKGLVIAGTQDGYFSDDLPIIEKINAAAPDLLLVCLGAPKQEFWMQKNRSKLSVGLMAGLGGSLDVFAGNVKRAPKIFQNLGLEWFYRLCCEPWRIKRMIKLPLFLVAVMGEKMRGKKK